MKIRIAGLLALTTLLSCSAPAPPPKPAAPTRPVTKTPPPPGKKPNILFAFADDWGRYASIYGKIEPGTVNDVIRTPHFDRIAAEGVLFTRAFVNAPSCTPCRSSLLSGQYFWRTGRGAILQGAVWDPTIPSYPLILRDHGYHIGYTFKVWSPGTPRDAPYGGQATRYARRGGRFNAFSQNLARAKDPEAAKKELLEETRGNFRDFLADRKKGQPFCYWFGPTNCHRKWVQGSGKKFWNIDPDALKGKMPRDLPDVPVTREDMADYLGEAQAFDAGLGVLVGELERIGELDNTIIVVSGDHGIPGFPRGKCDLYDLGVAVPLAVRWGAAVPKGRVVDDFVLLPDLAPTFLEVAGVTPPKVMTARSLVPVLCSKRSGRVDPTRDHVVVGRERHVARARTGQKPYPMRALRTDDFLYIRNFRPERWPMGTAPGYGAPDGPMPAHDALVKSTFVAFADLDASPTKAWLVTNRKQPAVSPHFNRGLGRRPAEELYDLRKDPSQLVNLAGDSEYEKTRAKLSARLMKILEETGDPRVRDDGSVFENPPFADPGK